MGLKLNMSVYIITFYNLQLALSLKFIIYHFKTMKAIRYSLIAYLDLLTLEYDFSKQTFFRFFS